MEFLKEILGDELFGQIESKINEHNGNEANKEKQVKIGNLGGGDYVAKGKYDSELEKLNSMLSGKTTELETANKLIADLKKGTKDDEALQQKISGYEKEVENLKTQLNDEKLKYALKFALQSEKAVDVDYMTFKVKEKLQEQGKSLELDENDNIKGWSELLTELKTQHPTQFETGTGNGKGQLIDPNRLPEPDKKTGLTKADLLKKPYAERQQIYNENPEAYKEIMNS